jgi:phosphatidylinositol kinase/protein kinase (PI-3  family)
MSIAKILGVIAPESRTKIKTNLDGVKGELPFLISLTKEERKKLRKIGPGRIGYVNEVNTASNANSSALAAGFKLNDYNTKLALYTALAEINSWVTPLKDSLDSTLIALGSELMKESDEAYGYLKVAASKENNQNLNSTIQKIMDILKHLRKPVKKS